MFNNPYPVIQLGQGKSAVKHPSQWWYYKFTTPNRVYFVTLEVYSFPMVAIKYCDLKDKKSRHRYNKVFNDGDAFRVIATCIKIMFDFWKQNPDVNFIFHAQPRVPQRKKSKSKFKKPPSAIEKSKTYTKVRFRIYRQIMLNYFSYEDFTHVTDEDNDIYVMLNTRLDVPTQTKAINNLKGYLAKNHDLVFIED